MMRFSYLATLILLALVASIFGQIRVSAGQSWQPSTGHVQLAIWPGKAPDARPVDAPEIFATALDDSGNKSLVAGKSWSYIARVSQPTMTVYSPQQRNGGAAVVVFPGGGYNILAIDLEGSEVCDWLTAKGIT